MYRLGLQICGGALMMGFSVASAAWFFLDARSTILFAIAAVFAIVGLVGIALVWISQRS